MTYTTWFNIVFNGVMLTLLGICAWGLVELLWHWRRYNPGGKGRHTRKPIVLERRQRGDKTEG